MSRSLAKLGFFSLICCLTAAHADVYKYKDEKGNVLYTDKPMFLPAERISIKTENSNIVDLNKQEEQQPAQNTPTAQRPANNSAASKNREANSADKAEACKKARENYMARMNAQRLYEEQADGERRYLTDKELDSARATAKQMMDTLCS